MTQDEAKELRVKGARFLTERGWPVIPLKGKRPITKGWQNSKPVGLDDVEELATRGNVGLVTGHGLIVVDIDAGADLSGLDLPETVTTLTPGGGEHKYFVTNGTVIGNSSGRLGPHIDVRGKGGQAVLPGSEHPNGRTYKWEKGHAPWEFEIAPLPDEILKKLKIPRRKYARPGENARRRMSARRAPRHLSGFVAAALAGEESALASAPEGQRNDQLNQSAFALGTLRDHGLDRTTAHRVLGNAARSVGLDEDEFEETFQSGWEAGCREPRDVGKIDNVPESDDTAPLSLGLFSHGQLQATNFPPRRHLLWPWLDHASLSMLVGPAGGGKTMLTCCLGLMIARGSGDFGPWRVRQKARVLLVDFEMPTFSIRDRLKEISKGLEMGDDPDLFVWSAVHYSTRTGTTPKLQDPGFRYELQKLVLDQGIDLLIVDNLASACPGLDENSAQDWGPINSWLVEMRGRGKSILLVHHCGKSAQAQQRGTSARVGNLDTVLSLNPTDVGFDVVFQKTRHFGGSAARSLSVRLDYGDAIRMDARVKDQTRDHPTPKHPDVQILLLEEKSQAEVHRITGVSKSTISRVNKSLSNCFGTGGKLNKSGQRKLSELQNGSAEDE